MSGCSPCEYLRRAQRFLDLKIEESPEKKTYRGVSPSAKQKYSGLDNSTGSLLLPTTPAINTIAFRLAPWIVFHSSLFAERLQRLIVIPAAATGSVSRPSFRHKGIGYDYAFADVVGENVVRSVVFSPCIDLRMRVVSCRGVFVSW